MNSNFIEEDSLNRKKSASENNHFILILQNIHQISIYIFRILFTFLLSCFQTDKNFTVNNLILQAKVLITFTLFNICCCFSQSKGVMGLAQNSNVMGHGNSIGLSRMNLLTIILHFFNVGSLSGAYFFCETTLLHSIRFVQLVRLAYLTKTLKSLLRLQILYDFVNILFWKVLLVAKSLCCFLNVSRKQQDNKASSKFALTWQVQQTYILFQNKNIFCATLKMCPDVLLLSTYPKIYIVMFLDTIIPLRAKRVGR